jgi:uroporphyrinogen decarboxylase
VDLQEREPLNGYERLKAAACVIGNIDPSGALALGAVDDVKRQTRKVLDVYVDCPRFILNAGCAIPAETPPENLRAMIATAQAGSTDDL